MNSNIFLGTSNALNLVMEGMPEKFLNYLPVTVICNLFVFKLTRQVVFKKFKDIYHLSTGFTSEKHWFSIIQKATYEICGSIMKEKFFDPAFFNYHFNHEDRLLSLAEKFRINSSLFSVSLQFLRCVRYCEKGHTAPPYCKLCSRVVDFHYNSRSYFRNIQVTSEGTSLLRLNSDTVCDLDVFVSNADDHYKFFQVKDDFCTYFVLFSNPEEVFVAFSSILIRIFVNVCFKFFNDLDLNITDDSKIRDIIMLQSLAFLARFWHEVNIDFFYEFFDKFDDYHLSHCFRNSSRKPEFAPFYPAAFDTTITVIRF